MSAKLAAYASLIDSKVVDYVDEKARVLELERDAKETRLANMIQTLMSEIDGLKTRISELEGASSTSASDDKYALTKAKLVRLMKDMGYYDGDNTSDG